MDSFEGGRRWDPRTPPAAADRRPPREPEARGWRDPQPLEQRLDRWMTTGRQLVEGVSGGRPGARQGSRRPEGRPGGRGGFDAVGRWVEDRLDWLLDDSDDWPEPWQENDRRLGEPSGRRASQPAPGRPAAGWSGAERGDRPRRPLEAISRRGLSAGPGAAPSPPAPDPQDWPDDSSFSVPRWQRPTQPLRRPDPLGSDHEQRGPRDPDAGGGTPEAASARPLPRSSRRR